MLRIYDAIRDRFLPGVREPALTATILMFNIGRIREDRHEVVKLQALDEAGEVYAEFSTVKW